MAARAQTRIRTDRFADSYTLLGRELGRGKWARRSAWRSHGREFAALLEAAQGRGLPGRHPPRDRGAGAGRPQPPRGGSARGLRDARRDRAGAGVRGRRGDFQQCVAEPDEAFTEQDVIRLVRQILRGVAHLHQNNVVHLDLKPQNILLTSSSPLGDIRIVDFGLSRRVDAGREVREILGTPEYVAPEVLSYEPISTATDMWSVGVLTYVMLTGESPFLGDTKQETFLNISQVNVQFPPDVFQGISDQAIGFIRSLLLRNPRKRAKAEQCLQHPWLALAPAP
ncbi:serine/threonine-protein kinase 17A-like, partial [Chelydra serpentina]